MLTQKWKNTYNFKLYPKEKDRPGSRNENIWFDVLKELKKLSLVSPKRFEILKVTVLFFSAPKVFLKLKIRL